MHAGRFLLILVFSLLLCSQKTSAQKNLVLSKDSIKVYNKLQDLSKRNKVTEALYKSVFRSVIVTEKKKAKPVKVKSMDAYNCKLIRRIEIQVLDPFGYDLLDTLKKPSNDVERRSNRLHIRSQKIAIRNFLLFRKGQEIDAYKISESERLIRQAGIFRDVVIIPTCPKDAVDSVDLLVRVIDRWSIIASVSASTSHARFRVADKNFMGTGHELSPSATFDRKLNLSAYSGTYTINRIGNTFINAKLYNNDEGDGVLQRGITVNRPFFSPLTKWAGGISYGYFSYNDYWYTPDTILQDRDLKYNLFDAYVSRSFHLPRTGLTQKKDVTYENIILSGRAMNMRQLTAGTLPDTTLLYRSSDQYFGMMALSLIDYKKQNYIFKFGEPEDIPVGKFYGFIGGIDTKNDIRYTGIRLGDASLSKYGYFSFLFEAGKYHYPSHTSTSSVSEQLTYYSPLFSIKNWNFRQFARPRISYSWNQPINRALVLNHTEGIPGFPGSVYGKNGASLFLQTQAYTPYSVLGFRFGPVLYSNFAMISDQRKDLFRGHLYSSAALGVLKKNDLLVFDIFQISIAFFPYLPGQLNNFELYAFRSFDFSLHDLTLDRPEPIVYH
jgi:hypothetical protein